jgi:hypothetical protein
LVFDPIAKNPDHLDILGWGPNIDFEGAVWSRYVIFFGSGRGFYNEACNWGFFTYSNPDLVQHLNF